MKLQNDRVGIGLMIATTFVFALQDGFSRHLAGEYNVMMVIMIRYWFFAAFVLTLASRQGGLLAAARTRQPILQISRGLLLVAEICIMVTGFVYLGLTESHAVFACYPLLVVALSNLFLGETSGWRTWSAVIIGFIGMLIILQPGVKTFSPYALIPFIAALMFAVYTLLTRFAARKDSAETSFFWTGIAGAVAITIIGIFFWEPMSARDWVWMIILCILGASGHYLLIKTYEYTDASTVQPFAFLQMVFASTIGITFLGETLTPSTLIGAALIIAAGLYTIWRQRQKR